MVKWDWSGTLRPLRDAFLIVFMGALILTGLSMMTSLPTRADGFLISFLASLWEDLAFFSAIGLALFVVQKHERDRTRTLADRLFILCNARNQLTNNERESLKERIADILSYVHFDRIELRIESFENANNTIELRVVRDLVFANYTTDMEATHAMRLTLTPTGRVKGHCLSLDTVETVELLPNASSEGIEREILLEAKETTEGVNEKLKSNKISGGNHRLYEVRYTSWVDLNQENGLFYKMTTRKYTQHVEVLVYNHSKNNLSVTYKRSNESAHSFSLKKDACTKAPIQLQDLRAGETCEFRISAAPKAGTSANAR